LDFVCLTLLLVETFTLDFSFTSVFDKVVVFHDFSTDEYSFEIGMDDSSSLGSLPSLTNSPALNFILTSSEEMNELKGFVTNISDL
jgi:hypothetical protein